MAGLRESKKQRTRDALVRAAHELFVSQGYEHTTVDEIATAVDVSQRTFFRYFAGKEDVAFAVQNMIQERFVAAFRDRPRREAPITALRGALAETWDSTGEAIAEVVPLDLHLRLAHVIETTPTLVAVELRRSTEMEERLALIVADREGLDPDADPRPRVLVAAFAAVMRVAMHRWALGDDITIERARREMDRHLDQLTPSLFSGWRSRRRGCPGRR
ncbi:TetR family transcriptional regulator [Streptomyces sp. TRM70308]|uniref:TetR family transcriptional regulator n=1 Tax=Streptomyces TaxID=1883 RepID=UPI0022490988|nr:TetR family transcriptional regulator [Streptomyces sp. JHD 1]MCX2971253.1 TetR family transcriptional regulator [Streptomyces sp. JHD 1]